MLKILWWSLSFAAIFLFTCQQAFALSEDELNAALVEYNEKSTNISRKATLADWAVATDSGNKEKEQQKIIAISESAEFDKSFFEKYWKNANAGDYKNESTVRQLFFLKQLGIAALNKDSLDQLTNIITTMTTKYNTATICPFDQQDNCPDSVRLKLDPDITELMAKSRDFDLLKYVWNEWHKESGLPMRDLYANYITLMNEAAKANNIPNIENAGQYWKSEFEDENFEENIDKLWQTVEPLYNELHTYMRHKLIEIYGDKINQSDDKIPAHLLGNMWAQSWENLYEETKPFKNASKLDITSKLKEKHYNALKMFETSDEFYMSLGLPTNNMSFTGESVIEQPTDRIIQCHASAWDFSDGKDFRIKMCTNINQEDFITIHHEMGHIQYYIQYKDLPAPFRHGANPGFHEAIGDTIALSVANPRHLVEIGLLDDFDNSEESNLNALYLEALKRIAFLPFGLLVDKWRWDVFDGDKIPQENWNKHWWDLREKYQKVSSPNERSNLDFDPGAKFHVPANSKYISYFISHILEFQLYKSLCIEAGKYDSSNPNTKLHECDFYRSEKAGKKLADGLKLGASKHWSEVLEVMTGETEINSNAIVEYFKPLQDHLIEENKRWLIEDEARKALDKFSEEATVYCHKAEIADWDQTTDLNNETKAEIYAQAVAERAKFNKEQYQQIFSQYNLDEIKDEKIKRQLRKVSRLGSNVLDETRLLELTDIINKMVKIYNTATFCNYTNQNCAENERQTLDPEITRVMAKSTDYAELEYTWAMWHNLTGPSMKSHYKKYIEINNEAAKLNKFNDAGEMWRVSFEDPHLVENMQKIWKQVEPLYDELHEYVKNQLHKIYGDKVNPRDKTIPAHLLGNMWAQSWNNLYERIKPYKKTSNVDITEALKRNNFTELKLFEESDRFYQSLGLESNKMSYTGESIIKKPKDRLIVCHASAWDLCDRNDFRIKMCTSVNQENFVTIHHEMGHIQYYILYKDQPFLFRNGANPGFHEAVGDVMALSVANPNHLKKINLLEDYKDTPEDNINALFNMALARVAFLPFGLLIDLYRYDLFSGKIPEDKWNKHWEDLREQYQKVRSPVPRNEIHFDAGAKFHVPADSQYISYFFSHILEFQILKSLCITAGQYEPNNPEKPLHKCDLEGSHIAGQRLRDGLSLGSSKHWSEALSLLTNGERNLSAEAILEYFKPLHEFLDTENEKLRNEIDNDEPSMLPYILGGLAGLIVVVLFIAIGIFYYNRNRT